jgi:EAL and modified HD-GYP domain-containing signal transduction protein
MINVLVARQPIFDRDRNVVAYELLFRSGRSSSYDGGDGDQETTDVLVASFLSIGMDVVTGGKKAFVNFTGNLIKNKLAHLLPSAILAVEILETVEPEDHVLESCRELKRLGYTIVLDDFVFHPRFQPLVELADIIKIDFLATTSEQRKYIVQRFASFTQIKFLAEKVETQDAFEEAVDIGYAYFQGYFFSKPVIIARKDIPASKLSYLRLLQEIKMNDMDVFRIEKIIKREMSFAYRLLKYINSSAFGFRQKIRSIRQAVVLLGQRELLKWVSLNAMSFIEDNKPPELIATAVIRAYLGELVALRLGLKDVASDIFLMGLFSLIDAILDFPLIDILEELPVSEEVKAALLGEESVFRDIHELTVSYERADWQGLFHYSEKLGLSEEALPELYLQTLAWVQDIAVK